MPLTLQFRSKRASKFLTSKWFECQSQAAHLSSYPPDWADEIFHGDKQYYVDKA